MNVLNMVKDRLLTGGFTCVLQCNETVYTSHERGVKPLVSVLQSGQSFIGGAAADKVVGKATAFLYVLLGVEAVYAAVISEPALRVLTACGIAVEYDVAVPHIINRRGDGMCPFEEAVLEIEDAHAAYNTICLKMKAMLETNTERKDIHV